jgi:xanthine dehydrogenase accessory factor
VSGVITAADAAQAAVDVANGARPIAIVAAVTEGGAVRRMIVPATGQPTGTLGHAALDEAALRHARHALDTPDTPPAVHSIQLDARAWLLYVETHFPHDHLIIVGAGHIAVPLAHLGTLLEFRVTVIDDREEFATSERFEDDVEVLRGDFASDPFAGVSIDERSYVALVTRGHRWDFDCLQRLVGRGGRPRYLGMIGSRRRVRAAFQALLAAGTPRSVLATIHAPIGLELNAETPPEIAVSIAAELVAVRRGAAADTISRRERVLDRLLKDQA